MLLGHGPQRKADNMQVSPLTEQEKVALQRRFYTNLHPQHGDAFAQKASTGTPPSEDVRQAERQESMQSWHQVQNSQLSEKISFMAWWMTQIFYTGSIPSPIQFSATYSAMVQFAVSVLGTLVSEKDVKLIADMPEVLFPMPFAGGLSETEEEKYSTLREYFKQMFPPGDESNE